MEKLARIYLNLRSRRRWGQVDTTPTCDLANADSKVGETTVSFIPDHAITIDVKTPWRRQTARPAS